jgi:GNAT superfamily N-acetyltransferase
LSPEDERRVISEINDHLSYSRPRAAAELWAQSGIPLSNLTRSEEIASHIRLWGFPQGIDSDWAQAELDDYTLDNYRRDPSNPLPRNHNEIDWENLPPQEQEGDLGSFEEAFGDAQMEDDESDDGGTEFGDYWYDSANFPNENSDGYARHRAIAHDDPSLWRDEVNNRVNRLLSTNQEEQAAYYWNFVRPRVDFTDLDRGALLQQHHEQYFNPDGSERYNGDEDDDEDSWGNELLPTDPKAPVENTTDPNAKLKSPWYKKVQHYPSGELPSEFSKRRLYDDFNFGEPGVANDSPSGGWHLFRPNEGVYQINDSRRPLHNPPVGYVHYEADHDDKSVKIKYLDVHPKKRGQGVATALVSALAEDFPDYKIAPGSTTSHGTGFVNYMQKNAPGAKERLDTDQWSPAPPNRLTDEQLNEWGVTKRRSPVFAFIDRHNARVAMRRMRIAAFNQELIDRLRGEYHDWYDENGNEALNWAGRGPLGNWRQIENFMKTKYPAAHRGLNAGQESVMPLLDFGSRVLSPLNGQKDTTAPYETGPEAFKQYGYDPKEVAAGMLLLHNQSHPQRGDMLDYDIDRLSDIAQKRSEMQRNYEQRQPQPITAALDLLRMANRIAGSRIT